MKKWSQTQFFVAAMVLVLVLVSVALLAKGLKKYDTEVYNAEQIMNKSAMAIPPSDPDAIVTELKAEEADANSLLEAEMAAETQSLEAEDADLTSITQSYE